MIDSRSGKQSKKKSYGLGLFLVFNGMGDLGSAHKTWLNGVPVGMLPQAYREFRADIDRFLHESASRSRRRETIETPSKRHSETANPRCLKTKDAARHLGISVWALRQEVNKGELPVVSSGEHTSSWKFDVRDLDAWIERHKITY